MKQIIGFLLITLSFVVSCKKNDDANKTYYIKFKVNGEPQQFYSQSAFQYYVRDNIGTNFITASLKDSVAEKSPDYIMLSLSGANIAHLTPADVPSKTNTMQLYYYDKDAKGFTVSSFSPQLDSYINLTVQQIDSTTVKGIFNAKAYRSTTPVIITDGEFYVKKQ